MKILGKTTLASLAVTILCVTSTPAAIEIQGGDGAVLGTMEQAGPPVEGNSWDVSWTAASFFVPFTKITATITSATPHTFEPIGLTVLSLPIPNPGGWGNTYDSLTHSEVSGPAATLISLNTHFMGDAATSAVSLYFQYYFGSSLVATTPTLYWNPGASQFDFTPVPEPTTLIAGALLLLPFAVSTIRFIRKSRAA